MEQLKIQEKKGANYNLLELFGVLDSYNFTELQQKAFVLIKENNLVLDLSNLTSMAPGQVWSCSHPQPLW